VRYMLEDIAYIHKNVAYKEDFELLEKRDEIWSQHKTNETISGPFHNLPVLHWNDTDTFAQTLTIDFSTSFYYDQLEPTITDYFVFEAFTVARDYHDKLIPNREDCQELIKLEQIMKERPGLANDFNKDLLFKRFTEKFFSKLNI
ncbi:unnamed protein product, partial [Rotaria sordida]